MTGTLNSFSLYGGWRKILGQAKDLKFTFGKFDDWNADVLKWGSEGPCYAIENDAGKYQFLALQFALEKSSYATMLIREMTHSSTEFSEQEALFKKIKELSGDKAEADVAAEENGADEPADE